MVFSVATLVQRQREIEKGLKHVKMPATQNYARLVLLKNAPLPYCDFSVLWTANVASQGNLAEKDPLPEISQGQNSSILSALNWSSVPGHMGIAWAVSKRGPVSPYTTAEKRFYYQSPQEEIQAIIRRG
jgi:hypothetical protein